MRRLIDKAETETILLEARTCVFIDSRREPTSLRLLVFDDAMLSTDYFFLAVNGLIASSGDPLAHFVVLDPSPIDHFHHLYGEYPVLEIESTDSVKEYLAAMNQDVGDGQGFNLRNLSSTWVIVPPSRRWFIHAIRSDTDDSGHLWLEPNEVSKLLAVAPGVFRPSGSG